MAITGPGSVPVMTVILPAKAYRQLKTELKAELKADLPRGQSFKARATPSSLTRTTRHRRASSRD